MSIFQFSDTPNVRHQVQALVGAIRVDGTDVRVHKTSPGCFMATVDACPEPLYAVAHGDVIHVHLKGQAWKIERVDPTRSTATAVAAGAGASHAPMPGVVVSLLVSSGQCVRQGDALLVIESMKMQMTISASINGEVAELPLLVGQTFQRGDVLVRVQTMSEAAPPQAAQALPGGADVTNPATRASARRKGSRT